MTDAPSTMHGFRRQSEQPSDFVFSRWLRAHKAISNYRHQGNSVTWTGPDGRVVAVAFYNNTDCTFVVWVREDLKDIQ